MSYDPQNDPFSDPSDPFFWRKLFPPAPQPPAIPAQPPAPPYGNRQKVRLRPLTDAEFLAAHGNAGNPIEALQAYRRAARRERLKDFLASLVIVPVRFVGILLGDFFRWLSITIGDVARIALFIVLLPILLISGCQFMQKNQNEDAYGIAAGIGSGVAHTIRGVSSGLWDGLTGEIKRPAKPAETSPASKPKQAKPDQRKRDARHQKARPD